MNSPTVVSLFSGCGGLDLGLKRAGFQIALASDIEPLCSLSHKANFGEEHPFFEGSVTDLSLSKVIEMTGLAPGEISLLAGGPPCPPYSKSRFYRKDKPRGVEDPVGDETLEGYLRLLAELRPKAFIFENVAGFHYKVHRAAFDRLMAVAAKAGYTTSYEVVNCADYGAPQIRKRFFMVGLRAGEFEFPPHTHSDPEKLQAGLFEATGVRPWTTAGEAIRDLDTEEMADDTGHFAGGRHHDLLCEVPPGDNYLYFTEERGHLDPKFEWRSRYWSFLLKLSPELPSWTIQARRSNNMGPFHWRNRILRISEVKRLQTFPDEFELCGTIEQQWRQVGNAVPPLVGEVLGSAILEAID